MKCYDTSKKSIYIIYLDANNLYGRAMIQYLPYRRFKWLNKKEINGFCLSSISRDSSVGIFQKFTLNILVNCMNYIMIIH